VRTSARVRLARGLLAVLLVVGPRVAAAWGPQGHRAIAEVAQVRLDARARAAVRALLAEGDRLADVSVWADDVRLAAQGAGPLAHDPEARRFNRDFPHNATWHFVDLPLGTRGYRDDGPFSGPDDVVHAIGRCVAVLEARAATPGFTRAEALRVLVHLVGDVHQPLHVGSGYYTVRAGRATLVTDPDAARRAPGDRGGNALCFHPSTGRCVGELHALWDGEMVATVGHGSAVAPLVAVLKHTAADGAWWDSHRADVEDPPGDYHAWAAEWASRSLAQARHAYDGIAFGRATLREGTIAEIAVTLPDHYAARERDRATTQLVAAGVHLAHLLNRVSWP
jgi:hypothetical protein